MCFYICLKQSLNFLNGALVNCAKIVSHVETIPVKAFVYKAFFRKKTLQKVKFLVLKMF